MLSAKELIELMRNAGFNVCGSLLENERYEGISLELSKVFGKADIYSWDKFIRLAYEQIKG